MLVDSHCHLDFPDFDRDRRDVIDRALKAGVGCMINIGASEEGTLKSVELSKNFDCVFPTVGVHPHDAKDVSEKTLNLFRRLFDRERIVAVGEVGLDFYRNLSPRDLQIKAFKSFIALAAELALPLVIHSRDAWAETVRTLKAEAKGRIKGAMHCFSGSLETMRECLGMGLHISFACNLTFKNASRIKALAEELPAERLLIETDAPFLAPESFRGKRNEPAYLEYLVDEIARIKRLSREDIARITTHNANALFRLGIDEPPKIAYPIRDSLYLNITNRCTGDCTFCTRNYSDFVKGHNLRLIREPAVEEILHSAQDPRGYREVVFCGYGEPTLRLDVVKAVAGELKSRYGSRIRLVTNGHGDLINSRPIAAELKGLVDKVSVSLNVDSEERYNRLCRPHFGAAAYKAVLDFIKSSVAAGIETEVTCLDLEGVDMRACEKIASGLGASFRGRTAGIVG